MSAGANRIRLWRQHPWPFAAFVGSALLQTAFLVLDVAEDVLTNYTIVRLDGWLVCWLATHRTSPAIAMAQPILSLGKWQVALLVVYVVTFLYGDTGVNRPRR